MIMHDVTKMPIIGKVTTKSLTYNVTFGDRTETYDMPAETYSVVHIFEDDGQKTYVTNVWHKEYKRVPLLIIEKLVDNYQPILEEGGYLHGSSHEFCDTGFKLDTEKEGQGESLFGRGLYFTKDQKLAEYYAKFVKPEGVNDAIRQKVADKLGFKTYDEIPYDFENKKIKTKYGEHLKFDLFHQYLKQYVDKSKEKGNVYKVTLFPGKDNSEYRILDFSGENHQLQENIERDKKDLKNIIDTLVKNKRKYSTWIKSYFDDKGLEFDPEKYNSDFKSTLRDMKDYYDNFYTYSTSTPLLKNLAYDLKKIFKPEFFRFTKNPLELTNNPNHYMSLQENRVKFNEDAKIYQGKRLTDFFQEAGYNAITYSFSPSIIPLEDNGEYDANAIVIFNDKDVKIDECEKAEDGKNIYYKPNQIKLADGSNTTFGKNKDIRYDNGGLIGSQEFKAWFGDWENHPETASKVVDENGYPKVVYHGTTSDFNEFNRTTGEFGSGIYFGSSDDATYFSNVSAGHNKFGNQSVIPVYLNIRNPFYYSVYSAKRAIPTRSKLISLGYDGVFGRTLNDTLEIVAFHSNQIKSSISNKKFNSDDNNILAEDGADIPVMDEETYLAINGAPSGFGDPALHKNRGGASDKAWTKIVDRQAAKDRELMAKREALRQEYKEKIEKGEIRPPSRNEKLISIAQGHPDLESTQAARRILQKKGVSWE